MGIVRRAQEVFVFHYWTLGGTFGTGSSVVIITGHFVVPLGQAVLWLSSLDTWWYPEDRQFCGYHGCCVLPMENARVIQHHL